MISIAVLAKEKSLFDLIITQYNHLPIHFHWFETVERFLDHQNFDEWQVIWVISKSIDWAQETLAHLNEQKIETPLVCSTTEPKQDQRQLFWQLNVREIIPWPVHRIELEYILKSYNEIFASTDQQEQYAFQGSLEFINGVDLLRTFTKATCTGVLYFHWGERKGRIEFKNGQIVNAVYRQMDPLTAVLIMASWKYGFVFFKDDQFVSKRSIMLTNDQIFAECLDYQKEYQKLIASFRMRKQPYYPHPDLNYEEFGPTERKVLRDMRRGRTIEEIIENYQGDVNFILKKLKNWADQQFIIPQEYYQQIKKQIEEEENASPIKRLMQKLFSKQEAETAQQPETEEHSEPLPALEHRFVQTDVLQEIKNRLEDLL
jgi:hypothetical protein